jgi:Tfp pilus assembly protein PilX
MDPHRQPRRQRGFTLVLVFFLIILMVGVLTALLVSAQGDLQVAAVDRESTSSFYAAETGAAYGKDWLLSRSPSPGTAAWTPILKGNPAVVCTVAVNSAQPGTALPPLQRSVSLKSGALLPSTACPAGEGCFNFCVRNNSLDPNWMNPTPANWADPNKRPDLNDADGVVTIEAYGWGPNGQVSRVSLDVLAAGAVASNEGGYGKAGGGEKGEGGMQTGVGAGLSYHQVP